MQRGVALPLSWRCRRALFELRGKQIRLFYVFLPGHLIVLLDGEIKKRDDIPRRTMERMKDLQAEVVGRGAARRGRGASE